MYPEYKYPSWEVNREADTRSRATARAIDLAIASGLFLAPWRVLLGMTAELKRQAEQTAVPEMELPKAA